MAGRVVVTGAGVISPIGAGLEEFEKALFRGDCGVKSSGRFQDARVAEVSDFNPQPWLGNKGVRVLDRGARLLCVATQMALGNDGLPEDGREVGMVCGTMFGSMHSIVSFDWSGVTEGPKNVNPMEFPNTVINSASGQAAIRYRLRGLNSSVCSGLASALYALNYAAECLRFGRAEMLLAGGAEELCDESMQGFLKTGVASPSGCALPFDAERDGTVPGEGCALWLLESEESAAARGASPRLEICGFGARQEARGIQQYSPKAEGATEAIQMALAASAIEPEQVACVVSSASGSRTGDAMEAAALRNVFGQRLDVLPVYAPKAALGEALGASGAFGAMAAGLALERQTLPPTTGSRRAEYGVRISPEPQRLDGEYALVNAFSCDGNCAALVLRQWKN
jgi:3-oxoacyl-[acyl-carrier-protein] synthase II